jgi:hypothetical protein
MKILKERSREYNGKSYYKYKINLSSSIVRDADLKEGDELEYSIKDKVIKLKKKKDN